MDVGKRVGGVDAAHRRARADEIAQSHMTKTLRQKAGKASSKEQSFEQGLAGILRRRSGKQKKEIPLTPVDRSMLTDSMLKALEELKGKKEILQAELLESSELTLKKSLKTTALGSKKTKLEALQEEIRAEALREGFTSRSHLRSASPSDGGEVFRARGKHLPESLRETREFREPIGTAFGTERVSEGASFQVSAALRSVAIEGSSAGGFSGQSSSENQGSLTRDGRALEDSSKRGGEEVALEFDSERHGKIELELWSPDGRSLDIDVRSGNDIQPSLQQRLLQRLERERYNVRQLSVNNPG